MTHHYATPGVYIEEFAPGAPIQGVGTSTAAFIGTASRGPIDRPVLIQSWDAFEETFGGFIAEEPTSYLAPAVYGFFLNGGTTCYVVRHGTGIMAFADLTQRPSGSDPVLIARAIAEGPGGNAISVEVVDSSRLERQLSRIGSSATGLTLHQASTGINTGGMDSFRRVLTVADKAGFTAQDPILLTATDGTEQPAIVEATRSTNKIVLFAPLPGTVDFGGGNVRTADLVPGQRRLRLTVPPTLHLNQALPRGSLIQISQSGGSTELGTVESSGGDVITLAEGLVNSYSMAVAGNLPVIASLEFDLFVLDTATGEREEFEQLNMNPHHPGYWGTAVVSELITLEEPTSPPSPIPTDPRPLANTYPLTNGTADDRNAAWAAINAAPDQYLDFLRAIDEISIVAIPGATDAGVQQAILTHCESMYDRVGILDSIRGADPSNGIRDQVAGVRGGDLGFAALYYPWLLTRNPLTRRDELTPPSGHIAGIYARVDVQRGVHKAPANTNIRGALGLEQRLTDAQQGPLNLMGINVLRVFSGRTQPVVWGARTTAENTNWQYVSVRRLMLYIEESIEEGIRWAVFEPNNRQLWGKLRRTITEFLTRVWRDGALFGGTPEEAFYVRIDEILNPPSTRALGRLYIEIGVAPSYPAEFIIVRIGLWDGGGEVSES